MSEIKNIISKYPQNQKIISRLKDIFVELVGVNISKIDIHTHFIEMGLDSLILLQIKRAIQEQLDIDIPFRLLLEDFSTIHALANHIAQQLPAEKLITKIEPVLTLNTSDTWEFEQENKKSTGGTVLEQVIAQQLELMSKQLELLQKTGSSGKVLPSPTAIQATPFQAKEQQTTQSLTNDFVNLASTSIKKKEFQQQPRNQTIESQQTEKEAIALLSPHQQKHLDDLIARFVQRTQESKRLTQVYRSYHANSRAVTGFVPYLKEMLYPIHGQRGEKARLWDVDGNEYVDISMGFGALLFGHSPSFAIAAIQEQIQQGILHGPQSRLSGHVAELICQLTGAERAAFCNDGTEAVMGAIRLARAATGRSKIALFAGSYHGTYDGVLVRGVTTSEEMSRSIPKAIGIPSYIAEDVIVLDYGKPKSLDILKAHAHELAAILVEPIQSSQPDLQPKEFLFQLRQLTQETGIVLIFDEVITGFRMHPGGIQGLWNIQADLTTYGKAVAGGMPIGVIAGKAALMDALDGGMWNYGDKSYPQAETTVFAGTFFKHPLVMATAWAALNHIKNSGSKLQEELSEKTSKLADTLNNYFEQKQVPIQVVNFGSLFRFIASTPLKFGNLFFYYLLEKGVYVWEGRTLYLSTAHTDEDIEHVIRAVKESVVEMQEGEFLPPSPSSTTDRESLKKPEGRGQRAEGTSLYEIQTPPDLEVLNSCSVAPCLNPYSILPSASSPLPFPIKVPLTEAQKELWFLAQMGNEASRAYNESRTIHLRGAFNLSALRSAVQEIINRHEALRTTFSPQGDYQLIHSSVIIDISFTDFSTLDKSEREAQLSQFFKQEAQQIFNLEQGRLLCFHVVKLEKKHHLLVITNHHIVADGWSIAILLRELAAIYSAECQGITCQLPQPMKWSEYVLWQAQMQQSAEMAKAEGYWLNKFAGSIPVLELPSDRPRPPIFNHAGARESLTLSTSLYNALKTLSTQRNHTLFTILLGAFVILLQRLTNQEDIVVGIASAGQSSIAGEHLIGHCVNLLPIYSQVGGDPIFTEYLSSIKQILLDAYEHQIYPFIKLIENLKLPRDPSRTPLFTTGFNLDKAQFESKSFKQEFEVVKNSTSATKLDINLNIAQTDSQLLVELEYNTDLFDPQTIQRWMGHYITLLESIVANPEQSLWELPLLTQTERQQLLVEWNNTQTDYPQNQCIHELFEAQVERTSGEGASPDGDATRTLTPDAIAVVFEDQHLTYGELNHRANQLAHYLRSLGVKPEVLVGICVERSLDIAIAILATLKAGGAYVPLDPSNPQERLALILEDAKPLVLLTQKHLVAELPKHEAKVVCIDADLEIDAFGCAEENPSSGVTSENLAYVIYTSGSTGTPKGVLITHQALVNHSIAAAKAYQLQPEDRILQFASISFDVAAEELFPSWLSGSTVVIRPNRILAFANFLQLLEQEKLTVLNLPTAYWHDWVSDLVQTEAPLPSTLRLVIVGTEQALPEKLALWEKLVGERIRWLNAYGPTEATIGATIYELAEPATCQENQFIYRVPIGCPIANTQIYLLDKHLNPTPLGVPGELYISGVGIARGYLNRPDLTAEKFIPNPFSEKSGTHLYKTGDLARYLPNGDIELLGRIDHQVKIRGFRIELGEIESKLKQHAKVREAVVVAREDEQGDKRLVAYVSPHCEQILTVTELRSFLQEKLPQYMVPSAFIVLQALPLLSNGKLDRHSLPAPETLRPEIEVAYVMPQTELEQKIATVWQNALNIENIGIHDNFFELGGHSLLMVKVHTQLREISKTDLSLLDLFRYPTISSLAEFFSQAHNQILPLSETNIQTEKIAAGKSQQKRRREKMKSIMNNKGVHES